MKRGMSAADVSISSSMSSAGTKRSVRDRIGNNADHSMWHGNGLGSNKRCVCAFVVFFIFYITTVVTDLQHYSYTHAQILALSVFVQKIHCG